VNRQKLTRDGTINMKPLTAAIFSELLKAIDATLSKQDILLLLGLWIVRETRHTEGHLEER
jgi:hypothetical protein